MQTKKANGWEAIVCFLFFIFGFLWYTIYKISVKESR
jgi:hypothetical protein